MNETPTVRLADYQPPAWRVRHVDIAFDLDLDASEVDCTLSLEPDPDQPPAELVLDSEELELLAIRLDEVPLPADEYGHAAVRVVLLSVRRARKPRPRGPLHPH